MKKKGANAGTRIIVGIFLFVLILLAEQYAIVNFSGMYLVIGALAVAGLLCLYAFLSGVITLLAQRDAKKEEQYESIFKSEKASYLLLKKSFEEMAERLNYLEEVMKLPTEEIINAQKGIAKVIIKRSHENTDALMNSYDQLMEQLDEIHSSTGGLSTILGSYKEEILAAQQQETHAEVDLSQPVQKIEEKLQELLIAMKDMELRLNQTIQNGQRVVVSAAAPAPAMAQPVLNEPVIPEEPLVEPETEPLPEETLIPEKPLAEPEAELLPEEPLIPEEPLAEPEAELLPEEPLIPEEPEEAFVEPEPIPEPEPEPIPELEPIPAAAPELDLSDPNKALNPDEIAALFASMGNDKNDAPAETFVEPEPIPEPEPAAPAAPELDLSDPNKALSPDEIAALFASMGS